MSAVSRAKNQLVRCLYQLTCAEAANSVPMGREICRRVSLVAASRAIRMARAALGGEATLRAVIAPASGRLALPKGADR
jgi:hypothetical protein